MSGVLVMVEVRRGELRDISLELLGLAGELVADGCDPVRVAVVGRDAEQYAPMLSAACVTEILTVSTPTEHFEPHLHAAAVEALAAETGADVILAGHTVDGMGWAGAVAVRLGLGFATDVTAAEWREGALCVRRGDYGDRLAATLDFPGKAATLITVRAGAFTAAASAETSVPVRAVLLADVAPRVEHLDYVEAESGDVDITTTDFLLSIGRGVEEEGDVARFEELAQALGATLSASRPLIDAGWLPQSRQVGQSGQTVKPKVYLALGISGAVQHLIGMRGADTIIAVNTDPDAPIFAVADYGAVADLHEVSEALAAKFAPP
ncbi:MAG: electron transfer flavoprotein subunit alpha/FixB family protein [Conexibacter sp.]|nr:electron transfer flavoprotein subunit alpha/FixB family protein [Conexibacter sp.]